MGRPKKNAEKAVKVDKVSFVDKAIAANNEKNPDNLRKFQERVIRYADREVQTIEDKLIDAKAAILDAEDHLEETSLQISLSEISTVASINSYIPIYVSSIEDALNAQNAKVNVVDQLERRKAFFTTLKKLVK